MPTLLEYRHRLRSVRQTQQITRAMKFVAAAQLRRAQSRVFAARPYAEEIVRVLRSAADRMEIPFHPLLERRPEQRLLVLVVSADKGLCGAFNSNVVRRATAFLRSHSDRELQVIAVGRRGRDSLRRQGRPLAGEYVDIFRHIDFRNAQQIARQAAGLFTEPKIDAVYAIYNEFKNVMVQKLVVEKVLPLDPHVVVPAEDEPAAATRDRSDYIYEDPPEAVFERMVPRYLESEIFRILLESAAGEQAARMTAMDAATNNAADLIERLTLEMNKVRQAAITKEIIEIVGGAAATAA
ncbi:MAG TPA: ATP synthase F1 subunit gamma [Candidatus Dormibacteraeota bacterium]|nr:ATP synthase F1 subunit gamma [Candidatus Dormibacteraeota bacterium]